MPKARGERGTLVLTKTTGEMGLLSNVGLRDGEDVVATGEYGRRGGDGSCTVTALKDRTGEAGFEE